MLLNNLCLLNDAVLANIKIKGNKIACITKEPVANTDEQTLHFSGAVAFPGLINSHDHLDFNCFAPLGNQVYNNYTDWGNHIHKNHKETINEVLKIPQALRAAWGMYKNLLAGVTTVINHGAKLKIEYPLISIWQDAQNLHSVMFEKNWRWQLNNPLLKNKTCNIHTGEGTDRQSAKEIDALLKWNLLKRKLVGIHAVAMSKSQAKKFTGLVWCPESNQMLLNRHAPIAQLKENTNVVFGTDSALTGHWNIWRHLRLARQLQQVNDEELFSMVTSKAAQLWGLNTGVLQAGKDADIVIAKTRTGRGDWNGFYTLNPADILLILHKGKIRLFDQSLSSQIQDPLQQEYSRINISDTTKFVAGDLPALLHAIRHYHAHANLPDEITDPVNSCSYA